MAIQPRSEPELVDIPHEIWASDQLSAYFARLAERVGPIFAFAPNAGPYAGNRVVYLIRPEANRFVFLTGREHFSHDLGWTPVIGETLGHGLLNMDPPEHTRHRALMNPAFTTVFMAAYLPLMQRIIAERSATWPERPEIDLMVEAREITFDVAAAALVGCALAPRSTGCANASTRCCAVRRKPATSTGMSSCAVSSRSGTSSPANCSSSSPSAARHPAAPAAKTSSACL
jgi:cytochrome P450